MHQCLENSAIIEKSRIEQIPNDPKERKFVTVTEYKIIENEKLRIEKMLLKERVDHKRGE